MPREAKFINSLGAEGIEITGDEVCKAEVSGRAESRHGRTTKRERIGERLIFVEERDEHCVVIGEPVIATNRKLVAIQTVRSRREQC